MLVHEVIPYIDILTEHLDDFADDDTLVATVRAAAERGRVVLNKYYKKTDESIVYRIAMSKHCPYSIYWYFANIFAVLHPAYKTQYFRLHKWTEEWIDEAKDIIKEEWETYYKPADIPVVPMFVSACSSSGASFTKAKNTAKTPVGAASGKQKGKAVANSARRSAQASVNAVCLSCTLGQAHSSFLSGVQGHVCVDLCERQQKQGHPHCLPVSDPLIYWDLVLKSAEDPKSADCALARMALDFLSIPGMPRSCNSMLASHS